MRRYPCPILKGLDDYIPFFKLEKLVAYAPMDLKESFTEYLKVSYEIIVLPSEVSDPFLARSGQQPIDWEWIADWAEIMGVETMVFCRYGENTPIEKAIKQLQIICEQGQGTSNVFDISTDLEIPSNDLIVFKSDKPGVQVRSWV
jgi:hypothetical protein